MRAGSRRLCGLAVGLIGCLAIPQSVAAAPCTPAEDRRLISLSAPTLLAFERGASILVDAKESASADEMENVRLEYRDSQGDVFFSRSLTRREIASLARDKTLHFPIRADAGAGPLVAQLFYTERTTFRSDIVGGPPERRCEVRREKTIRPIAGLQPRPNMSHQERLSNSGSPFAVNAGTSCERLAPGVLRIVISHHHAKRTWQLRSDPCGTTYVGDFPRWDRRGSIIPGLRDLPDAFFALDVVAHRRWTRDYRVEVFWNGNRLLRRWIRIRIPVYQPRRRIYEDDEDFAESCPSGLSKGPDATLHRDAKGRVYCNNGPVWTWRGKIYKTRPRATRP